MADTLEEVAVEQEQEQESTPLQADYIPRSKGMVIGTLAPAGIAAGMRLSLDRVEQVTELDVDTYVAAKLGCTHETLFARYAAEQIDTLAITFLDQELGLQSTITHDTGIGKGRIVAALVQAAIAPVEMPDLVGKTPEQQQEILKGLAEGMEAAAAQNQIAVFVTAKPDLYVDMLARDMVDTGVAEYIRPFYTNSDLDITMQSPDGAVTGYVRTPKTAAQNREMMSLMQQYEQTGTLGKYNAVFTTYDQIKEKDSIRRQFLETIAPGATFVLDECDLAGGASGETPKLNAKERVKEAAGEDIRSISEYVCNSLLPKSKAYINLSATAAKDPYVLNRLIYSRSDVKEIGLYPEELAKKLAEQGVPAQQDFANRLAMNGELMRLEKNMAGVEFGITEIPVDLEVFEQSIDFMQRVVEFDRIKQAVVEEMKEDLKGEAKAIRGSDPSAGEASITSTNFTSTTYNFAQQLLFSLKAESIADRAIAAIENGQKPKIDFYNTMQSMLETYLDEKKEEFWDEIEIPLRAREFDKIRDAFSKDSLNEIEKAFQAQFGKQIEREAKAAYQDWFSTNPPITMNFGDLLIRQIERCRMVTIGDPYGVKERHRLTDDELGIEAVAMIDEIIVDVREANWDGLPISPIDAIVQRVENAGYVIGEMSGRSLGLDYSTDIPTIKAVEASDPKVRSDVKSGFNNGSVDAIITNITTGWSAHAQVGKVKDLRQRINIVAQPHSNPNMLVQSLGRVNRTGQLDPSKVEPERMDGDRPVWGEVTERYGIKGKFGLPIVEIVQADGVPYERRVVANINRKFASLNANTTGNRQSGTDFGGVDFNNAIGDLVVERILEDFPELDKALDYPLVKMETNARAANKVTGRSIFLSLPQQKLLMDLIETRFTEAIVQLEALGESPMEQKTFDLQATTLERLDFVPSQSDGIFGGAVYVEKARIRSLRKPFTAEQVAEKVQQYAEIEDDTPASTSDLRENSRLRSLAQGKHLAVIDTVQERINQVIAQQNTELDELAERSKNFDEVRDQHTSLAFSIKDLKTEIKALKTEIKALSVSLLPKEEKAIDKARLTALTAAKQSELDDQNAQLLPIAKEFSDLKDMRNRQEKILVMQGKIKDGWESTESKLNLCVPGQPLSISTASDGTLYGIVTDVQRVEAVQSPIAGGAWKVKLALADASREITLSLNQICSPLEKPNNRQVRLSAADNSCYMFMPGKVLKGEVRELLDALQAESYEIRQIVTGELLNSPKNGKFLKFTTAEGQTRQGILLPRGTDIEKDLEKQPVRVSEVDQIEVLLSENVQLSAKGITLRSSTHWSNALGRSQDGILLKVKATKKEGGEFYTNKDLIKLTQNKEGETGFESSGSGKNKAMQAFVPEENTRSLIAWLKAQGLTLEVADPKYKEAARALVGETTARFAKVEDSVSLEVQEAKEFQIPVEKLRERIKQVSQQRQANDSIRLDFIRQSMELNLEASEPQKPDGFIQDFITQAIEKGTRDAKALENFDKKADLVEASESLVEAYRAHFSEGNEFASIRSARTFATEHLEAIGYKGELSNRTIEECIEKSVVLVAAQVSRDSSDRLQTFDNLVELYESMPRLMSRTSDSVMLQQYSTPIPLGILAQQLAGIDAEKTVYEPTAGNGALLTAANPSLITANELDPNRASQLRKQGYGTTQRDAAEYRPDQQFDVVIANPPFGKTEDLEGNTQKILIELSNPAPGTRAYPTAKLDHAIAFKSLAAMKEDGKAVLILGAPMEQKTGAEASDAYNGPENRAFFHTLYNNYNVTQHFTVSGDLYGKQGTSFPVDVLVIDGRGESELSLPAAETPLVYRTWEQLREVMVESVGQSLDQRRSLESLLEPEPELNTPEQSTFKITRDALDVDVYQLPNSEKYGASFKPTPESNPITSIQGISKEAAIAWGENILAQQIAAKRPPQPELQQPASTTKSTPQMPSKSDQIATPSTSKKLQRREEREAKNAEILENTGIDTGSNQTGRAERNIANFLHQSGIADAGLMQGDDYHLRIDMNPPMIPLVVERHDDNLYLTHYIDMHGDTVMDAEMVFAIANEGKLYLTETAVQNPIRGGESRGLDRGFAGTFSSNILDQGFVAACQKQLSEKEVNTPEQSIAVEPEEQPKFDLSNLPQAQREKVESTLEIGMNLEGYELLDVVQLQDKSVQVQGMKGDRTMSPIILDTGEIARSPGLFSRTPDYPGTSLKVGIQAEQEVAIVDQPEVKVPEINAQAQALPATVSDAKPVFPSHPEPEFIITPLKFAPRFTTPTPAPQKVESAEAIANTPEPAISVAVEKEAEPAEPTAEQVADDVERSRRAQLWKQRSSTTPATPPIPNPTPPTPKPTPLEATRQLLEKHDPQTLKALETATSERYSPSLRELRDWFKNAKTLERQDAYTDRIKGISDEMLLNTPEQSKPNKERDTSFRNPDFALAGKAQTAMQRDAVQARNVEIAHMGKEILAAIGSNKGSTRTFERPNGNYRLEFNNESKTLTVWAKNQGDRPILTEINGKVQHDSAQTTDLDKQTFKAFKQAVQQAAQLKKAEGQR